MNDKPMIAPLGDLPENEPTENSSLEELGAYALLKQNEIISRDKRNGEDLWLMGRALEWAYKKTPYGQWEKWFKSQGLKKTYVWLARTLHEKATFNEVKELGSTQALRKFGLLHEKESQAGGSSKKKEADEGDGVPTRDKEVKEEAPTPGPIQVAENQTEASESSNANEGGVDDEADKQPTDNLADEEKREFEEFEASIRKLTPKTKAVAIHHALELLRDDLKGQEIDEELQETFGQIAHLAEELNGGSQHVEAA